MIAGVLATAAAARAEIVYVSSLGTHEVLRYDATTGNYVDIFITAASGGLSQPHGILERCDDILVASFGNHRVLRYHRDTGAFIDVFLPTANGLSQPTYLQYGPDGNLYVSSQGSDQILRYTTEGVFIDAFVTAGSGGLDGPSGFAFGPDGRLYVAGRYSANVIAYDATSGAFAEVIADAADGLGAGNTFGLNFGDNGDLYFASNGVVFRYDLDSASILTTIPVGGIGIEPGPAGDIFVATANNLRIIDTGDNSVSGLFLSGGVINTLNFFRFPSASPAPGCVAVPAVSSWAMMILAILVLTAGTVVVTRPARQMASCGDMGGSP
jgi:DNA-binding beta-propeller fold protein YncE